jgi:hypothetical protein
MKAIAGDKESRNRRRACFPGDAGDDDALQKVETT